MGIEAVMEVTEDLRSKLVERIIVGSLPEQERDEARERATRIVVNYAGRDREALSILLYAAEQGKFYDYAAKLETHYNANLAFVHPDARKHGKVPGARRASEFILNCYSELCIRPRG